MPPVPVTRCVYPELTWPHPAAVSWDSGSRPGLWRSSASVPHSAGILSPRLQSHIAIRQQEGHGPLRFARVLIFMQWGNNRTNNFLPLKLFDLSLGIM